MKNIEKSYSKSDIFLAQKLIFFLIASPTSKILFGIFSLSFFLICTLFKLNIWSNPEKLVSKETKYATGLPAFCGGSDDPSEFTAYGVLMGIKAAIKHIFDSDNICGKKIFVEGVGKVGKYLVNYLSKEGAEIYISDIFFIKIVISF